MRLLPIVKALSLQLLSLFLVAVAAHYFNLGLSILVVASLTGVIAAGLSTLFRLPPWWIPIQLLFMPALAGMSLMNIPSWLYLAAFILFALVYWSTFRSQVPLYLSSRQVKVALEQQLPQGRSFSFVDIGSGLGGVLAHLSHARPDGQFAGRENAPLPFLIAWMRLYRCRNCNMQRGNFWELDFGNYDVVYAYLSPVPMPQLWEKASREMRPGSLLISNTFEIPGHPPDWIVELRDFHQSLLLVWKIT